MRWIPRREVVCRSILFLAKATMAFDFGARVPTGDGGVLLLRYITNAVLGTMNHPESHGSSPLGLGTCQPGGIATGH